MKILPHCCFLFVTILLQHTFAYRTNSHIKRYFTAELHLPPLSTVDAPTGISNYRRRRPLPVVYTNDPAQVSNWLNDNVPRQGCTLGFDVESVPEAPWIRPSFRGPAVVQLATTKSALVVHLTRPCGRFCRASQPILEAVIRDETIIKAGCGIDHDMLELKSVFSNLEARSRLDLCGLRAHTEKQTPGLKTLTGQILGLELPKCRTLSRSDWSQFPLSSQQVAYSALDAWAGAAIVDELALRDPATFSTDALIDRLKSQRSVRELHHRQITRRRAKSILSTLLEPYQSKSIQHGAKRKRPNSKVATLPFWKAALVRELNAVVRANKHEMGEAFGAHLLQNQTAAV